MRIIKQMKFTGVLMFFLAFGVYSRATAQNKNWDFSDGTSVNYSSWRIVENRGKLSKVFVVGGNRLSPTWEACTIEEQSHEFLYTYVRVKYYVNGFETVSELNLYWNEDILTRVRADGSTKNFWLRK